MTRYSALITQAMQSLQQRHAVHALHAAVCQPLAAWRPSPHVTSLHAHCLERMSSSLPLHVHKATMQCHARTLCFAQPQHHSTPRATRRPPANSHGHVSGSYTSSRHASSSSSTSDSDSGSSSRKWSGGAKPARSVDSSRPKAHVNRHSDGFDRHDAVKSSSRADCADRGGVEHGQSGAPPLSRADYISSSTNAYVKHCVKLRESARYRADVGSFMLVGLDLLQEAAGGSHGDLAVQVLFVLEDSPSHRNPSHQAWLRADRTVVVAEGVMRKITGLDSVAGVEVAAEVALPPATNDLRQLLLPGSGSGDAGDSENSVRAGGAAEQLLQRQLRVLALDRVQDPGNLGSLLRTALAFGWDAVYMLPGCCDPFNGKAVRASRGAALRMPIAFGSLEGLLEAAKELDLLLLAAEPQLDQDQQPAAAGADGRRHHRQPGSGASGAQVPPAAGPGSVCLVLGSEGQGLSPEVSQACTPVSIPMSGAMESLNVGIAGGILMCALSSGMPALLRRLQRLREPQPQREVQQPQQGEQRREHQRYEGRQRQRWQQHDGDGQGEGAGEEGQGLRRQLQRQQQPRWRE